MLELASFKKRIWLWVFSKRFSPRNLLKFIGAGLFAAGHGLQCIHKGSAAAWSWGGAPRKTRGFFDQRRVVHCTCDLNHTKIFSTDLDVGHFHLFELRNTPIGATSWPVLLVCVQSAYYQLNKHQNSFFENTRITQWPFWREKEVASLSAKIGRSVCFFRIPLRGTLPLGVPCWAARSPSHYWHLGLMAGSFCLVSPWFWEKVSTFYPRFWVFLVLEDFKNTFITHPIPETKENTEKHQKEFESGELCKTFLSLSEVVAPCGLWSIAATCLACRYWEVATWHWSLCCLAETALGWGKW